MCSLASIQPQISLPLSHFASAWGAVRFQGRNTKHKQHRKQSTVATSPIVSDDVFGPVTQSEIQITDLFHQLGLQNLAVNVAQDSINRLLCPSVESSTIQRVASEFHVSASTFFENKYGFPEAMLSHSPTAFNGWYKRRQNVTYSLAYQMHQVRGFKTRQSGQTTGIGSLRKMSIDDNIKSLKQAMLEKVSGVSDIKSSEKLRMMMADADLSPAVQEKLKVAFAEGYMAHLSKPGGSSLLRWLRYIMTSVFIMTVALLIFNILINTATGDMKINMLKGERFEVNPEEINVTFSDVKGVDEAKQELTDVVEFLRDPEKFTILGAKLPKGKSLVLALF